VLQLADPSEPCIVNCDARDIGVSAVLEEESENEPHPIAFSSRKLPIAEKTWPVHELELLVIVYAIKKWSPYLHGSRFVIQNVPSSIVLSGCSNQLVMRQMRWMEVLPNYYYEIVDVQGKFRISSIGDKCGDLNWPGDEVVKGYANWSRRDFQFDEGDALLFPLRIHFLKLSR
jgi:hypothetical protein